MSPTQLFAFLAVTAAKLPCSKKICALCQPSKHHLPTNIVLECERFLTTKCCDAYGFDAHHGLTLSTSKREVIPPPEPAVIESGHGFHNKTVWLMFAIILTFVFFASAFEKLIILTCSKLSGNKPSENEHFF